MEGEAGSVRGGLESADGQGRETVPAGAGEVGAHHRQPRRSEVLEVRHLEMRHGLGHGLQQRLQVRQQRGGPGAG